MPDDSTDDRPVTRAEFEELRERVEDAWRWIKDREDHKWRTGEYD